MWAAWGRGEISSEAAQAAAEAAHAVTRRSPPGHHPVGFKNVCTRFPARRPQRSPDRQRSIERRRMLAASGPLPPALAAKFTVSEQAVLKIVGDEHRHHGFCDHSVPEIAARAGVCVRLAQMAFREAERLGLVHVEHRPLAPCRHDTNMVTAVDAEWLAWLARGPKSGCKKIQPTDTRFKNSGKLRAGERPKGASGDRMAAWRPPDH
jgi:hypothetical protein